MTRPPDPSTIEVGRSGDYRWVACADPAVHLSMVVAACPRLVAGRYVTVTACDSSPLVLSDEERARGWAIDGESAVSPMITVPNPDLPFCEYDEWWVFGRPTPLQGVEVFVNFGGFTLDPPRHQEESFRRNQQDRFWSELSTRRPVSYVAEGDLLNMATRDPEAWMQLASWAGKQQQAPKPVHGERLRRDFPDLAQFLGAYFHQDWSLDHESADEVIEFYRIDVDDETRSRVITQIAALLAEESDVTDTMLSDLWCSYVTWSDGFSPSEWLRHVQQRLSPG